MEEAPDQEMRSSPLGLSVVTSGHVTLLGISWHCHSSDALHSLGLDIIIPMLQIRKLML